MLASLRTSRRPPANRRCRSRGLWPLGGPPLRSAPSAPSLAFAAALLSGRAERGAPAPAVRRLNTETRFARRWTLALCDGIGLRPCLETTASRLAGRVALAWRRPASPAPGNRLRASPSARASTSSPVAPSAGSGRNRLDVSAARRDGGAWCSLRFALHGVRLPTGAAALAAFGRSAARPCARCLRPLRWRSLALSYRAAPEHRRAARAARARFALRETETRFARRWTLALRDGLGLWPCLETTAARLAERFALARRRPATPAPVNRLRASPSARAATSSPVAPFAGSGRKQARRLRCASRRRRLVLASLRTSRRPPANRRCRSRGLWPLGGPPLRSAPSAPSLAFAAALLSGRAERGAPAPAVRRLNTETRFARRWTLALCDGIGLRPCLETTASRLAGRVALAWWRPATPAPGKRLRASPLARAATSSPVASFASVGRKKPRRLRCASRRRRLEPVP